MNKDVENYFIGFLKQEKLKVTPERIAILNELFKIESHFDADEFFLHLKKNRIPVSRATVYRTLELLDKATIVRKTNLGDAHAHYELIWNQKHHDHLICINCGKIVEFLDESIEKEQELVASKYDFKLIRHCLQLYGICPECQQKKSGK